MPWFAFPHRLVRFFLVTALAVPAVSRMRAHVVQALARLPR